MNNHEPLSKARALLYKLDLSCVIINKNEFYQSAKKGISPLLTELEKNPAIFVGAFAADKIIGKAAAMLLAKGGVSAVYGMVMSKTAQEIFKKQNIYFEFEEETDFIKNRTGDGMCPMEKSVSELSSDSLDEAYDVLNETYQKLCANSSDLS